MPRPREPFARKTFNVQIFKDVFDRLETLRHLRQLPSYGRALIVQDALREFLAAPPAVPPEFPVPDGNPRPQEKRALSLTIVAELVDRLDQLALRRGIPANNRGILVHEALVAYLLRQPELRDVPLQAPVPAPRPQPAAAAHAEAEAPVSSAGGTGE